MTLLRLGRISKSEPTPHRACTAEVDAIPTSLGGSGARFPGRALEDRENRTVFEPNGPAVSWWEKRRYAFSVVKQRETNTLSPAETAEAIRVRRLREDARRPISVNLAEGIALSHKLMRFTGAARGN